jgi:hypothetical protein
MKGSYQSVNVMSEDYRWKTTGERDFRDWTAAKQCLLAVQKRIAQVD